MKINQEELAAAILEAIPKEKRESIVKELPRIAHSFGQFVDTQKERDAAARKIISMFNDAEFGMSDFAAMEPIPGLTVLTLCALLDDETIDKAKKIRSEMAQAGARGKLEKDVDGKQDAKRKAKELWIPLVGGVAGAGAGYVAGSTTPGKVLVDGVLVTYEDKDLKTYSIPLVGNLCEYVPGKAVMTVNHAPRRNH